MKIRLTSRSGDTDEEREVPDDTEGFLNWMREQGRVSAIAPGNSIRGGKFAGFDASPLWTLHLEDEYD